MQVTGRLPALPTIAFPDDDHFRVGLEGLDGAQLGPCIHAWHAQLEQDNIERGFLQALKRYWATGGGLHFAATS